MTTVQVLVEKGSHRNITFRPPSTRIWIFLNPQLFLSGFKKFPVYTERIQIEFASPIASDGVRIHSGTQGSSTIKYVQSMRHKALDSGGKYALLLLLLLLSRLIVR